MDSWPDSQKPDDFLEKVGAHGVFTDAETNADFDLSSPLIPNFEFLVLNSGEIAAVLASAWSEFDLPADHENAGWGWQVSCTIDHEGEIHLYESTWE